ncbi:MAG TPA: hypothetical protein VH413_02495 [Verrucomicrobiae bacterium]|nr:hypothetical protein [Verrucomicrobiae bacterium]
MNYNFPLWKPSRPYVCPANAGPSWHEAFESGMDMAELEDNLKLSPWERMVKHDQILNDFLQREEFFNFMQRGREFVNRVEANRNLQSKI